MPTNPSSQAPPRRGPWPRGERWNVVALVLRVLLLLLLLTAVEILATRHNIRIDTTPEKSFVLAPQSARIAENLAEPLRIVVFYDGREVGRRRDTADLLDRFRAASEHIRYEMHDLDRSPALAARYGVTAYGSGVITSTARQARLGAVDEESIVAALLQLTRSGTRLVCFSTGHGERDPRDTDERSGYSTVAKDLERETFRVDTLPYPLTSDALSPCTAIVLAGPRGDFLPEELDALSVKLEAGGRILALVDPPTPTRLAAWLRKAGIEPGDDFAVDERNRLLGADSFTVRVPVFDQRIYGPELNSVAVFPVAQTIRPLDEAPPPHTEPALLALGASDTWALVGSAQIPADAPRFRPGVDRRGPLPLGARSALSPRSSARIEPAAGSGQLAVFGDADFASNLYLNLLGNRDLFLATIAWLADRPDLAAPRPRRESAGTFSTIPLGEDEARLLFWLSVVGLPSVCVLIGFVVTSQRKARRGGR